MKRNTVWLLAAILLALALYAVSYAQSDTAWVFVSADADHEPLASFVDGTGNVYVVGWTEGATTHADILLLKIDSLGRQVWARAYDNGANREDVAGGAVRDTSGNIYICAGVADSSRGLVGLLKYDPGGNLVWMRSYGEANRDYAAAGVALDDSQNVYICGVTESPSDPIVRVLKYGPNGDLLWVRSYTASEYRPIWGARFHVLADGGIYLALSAEHPQRFNDWIVVRLTLQGDVQWEKIYKETGTRFERLNWSQVDEQANIYLTGDVISPTSCGADFCTMKIDSSGNVLWTREYNGPENLEDEPQHLLLDRGNTYVVGRSVFEERGEYTVMTLVKYDSLGNELWVRRYASGGTSCIMGYEDASDQPPFCSMSADESGYVYLTGAASCYSDTLFSHAVVLKYDSLGNRVWARKYAEQGSSWGGALVDFDGAGGLYSIGIVGGGRCGIFVVKYRGR